MPARRAPVKKKSAAKSAAPALAKKVAAKKKPTVAKKAAPSPLQGLADKIVKAIKEGEFDGHLGTIDGALTDRVNARQEEQTKAATPSKSKTADEKTVATAPKRGASSEKAVDSPESGKTYAVSAKVKKLAGTKVKFIRLKSDDESKAVLEVLEDKPGYPKGKRIMVPVSALVVAAASRKK